MTIQMEGIETEQDVGVRTAAVNLLVHIVMTQKSLVVPDLLNMLEKVILIRLYHTIPSINYSLSVRYGSRVFGQ